MHDVKCALLGLLIVFICQKHTLQYFKLSRLQNKRMYSVCIEQSHFFCLFSIYVTPLISIPDVPPQTHLLCSPIPLPPPSSSFLHTWPMSPPSSSFLPWLSCLQSFICHPQPSSLPLHPFVTAAFKESSHLGILTAFSRQLPAPQRDLNREEPRVGYLPKTVWHPFEFFHGCSLMGCTCMFFYMGACVSLCCIR